MLNVNALTYPSVIEHQDAECRKVKVFISGVTIRYFVQYTSS